MGRVSSRRSSDAGRPVASAASRHATAGPRARSTQNRRSSVQTEPSHAIVASTGAAAASASRCQGHARTRSRAETIPAARTPTANSAARSGGDWITNVSRRGMYGPAMPTTTTTSVTAATMLTAPQRRTSRRSSGNTTYSCASTAIDQNDRSGLGAWITFCSSRPFTTTEPRVGRGLSRRRNDQPGHRQAERERRPERRQDPACPPAREPRDPVEAPAPASRRQRQREARQHDEHDDGEAAVDEPRGPERRVVDRVARERAEEDVIHDHEQRGEATEAVQAGDARRVTDRPDGGRTFQPRRPLGRGRDGGARSHLCSVRDRR